MPTHILWYFDNNTSTPATQLDVGPFNPGNVSHIYKGYVHGNMSFLSFTTASHWQEVVDMVWGLQYVDHGAGPENILTSATDDHWLWRHAVAMNNDLSRAFTPSTDSFEVQSTFSLIETYRGQGNKPGGDIDVYLSFDSIFGVTSDHYQVIGSIDFYFD